MPVPVDDNLRYGQRYRVRYFSDDILLEFVAPFTNRHPDTGAYQFTGATFGVDVSDFIELWETNCPSTPPHRLYSETRLL